MNDRIIPQLLETMRSSPMLLPTQFEVALRALAWAQLSRRGELPEALQLTPAVIADPDRLAQALSDIADISPILSQAFEMTRSVELNSAPVRAAFELALRLADTGILEGFDATDAITALPTRRFGDWSLAPDVASLLVELADLRSGESVYTPWDVGAQLASRSSANDRRVYLETPIGSAIPALVSLLTNKAVEIHSSDPINAPSLTPDGKLRRFDVSIAFPPMGQNYPSGVHERDWFGRFPERTQSGSVLAIRHMLAQTDRRIVVGVPNKLTFSPGAERSLRDDLIRKGMVRSVIAMPAGLLESTNLAFTVLVLEPAGRHGSVQFIDAAADLVMESASRGRLKLKDPIELVKLVNSRSEAGFSRLMLSDEVLENEAQLQASRYVLPKSAQELQAKLERAATVALGDIAMTARPMPVTKHGPGTEVREIGAADIPAYGYILQPGRTVQADDSPKNRQNYLRPLDIVLMVKGSVGKVGIVPEDVPPPGPGGWVAGQSAIVLRVEDEKVDPRALAVQLRSPFGQQLLKQIVSGATIPFIQIRELMRLSVLVPDKAEAAAAISALKKEGELQEQLEALKSQLAEVSADLWPLA